MKWRTLLPKEVVFIQEDIDVLPKRGPHDFLALHLLGLGFWTSRVFGIPVYCKKSFRASF
jgi:hypothetical protein